MRTNWAVVLALRESGVKGSYWNMRDTIAWYVTLRVAAAVDLAPRQEVYGYPPHRHPSLQAFMAEVNPEGIGADSHRSSPHHPARRLR